jgi:N,N'-diacetyl-8-epilegionaminate cytidylyltransferase
MNVLGVILARGGSKGIPGKNIRALGGRPLIAWTVEIAKRCPSIERVVLSTDDAAIAEAGRQCGAEVPFLRPESLARDDTPRARVWEHLVDELQKRGYRFDAMADLQIPAPFRSVEDVETCLRELRHGDFDGVITICEPSRNPYFNMVEMDGRGCLNIVKPLPVRPANRQEAPVVYSMTTVCFAVRKSFVERKVDLLDGKIKGVLVPPERALDLDNEMDWAFAEFLVQKGKVKAPWDETPSI